MRNLIIGMLDMQDNLFCLSDKCLIFMQIPLSFSYRMESNNPED